MLGSNMRTSMSAALAVAVMALTVGFVAPACSGNSATDTAASNPGTGNEPGNNGQVTTKTATLAFVAYATKDGTRTPLTDVTITLVDEATGKDLLTDTPIAQATAKVAMGSYTCMAKAKGVQESQTIAVTMADLNTTKTVEVDIAIEDDPTPPDPPGEFVAFKEDCWADFYGESGNVFQSFGFYGSYNETAKLLRFEGVDDGVKLLGGDFTVDTEHKKLSLETEPKSTPAGTLVKKKATGNYEEGFKSVTLEATQLDSYDDGKTWDSHQFTVGITCGH